MRAKETERHFKLENSLTKLCSSGEEEREDWHSKDLKEMILSALFWGEMVVMSVDSTVFSWLLDFTSTCLSALFQLCNLDILHIEYPDFSLVETMFINYCVGYLLICCEVVSNSFHINPYSVKLQFITM